MLKPPHPGEILKKDYLIPLNLTVTQTAEALGIARKNLSAIINGRAGISPLMAIRLSKAFGNEPEFWLNLQTTYNLWLALEDVKDLRVEKLYDEAK